MNRYMKFFAFAAMLVIAQVNAKETPSRFARLGAALKAAPSSIWSGIKATPSAIATGVKTAAHAVAVDAPVAFWNKTFKSHPYISGTTTLVTAAAIAAAVYYKDTIKSWINQEENEDLN